MSATRFPVSPSLTAFLESSSQQLLSRPASNPGDTSLSSTSELCTFTMSLRRNVTTSRFFLATRHSSLAALSTQVPDFTLFRSFSFIALRAPHGEEKVRNRLHLSRFIPDNN